MVTRFPSAVTDSAGAPKVSFHRPMSSAPGNSFLRFSVKATSSAVKGSPSDQVTPSRIVNTSVVSEVHSNSVASHGTISQFIELRIISGS